MSVPTAANAANKPLHVTLLPTRLGNLLGSKVTRKGFAGVAYEEALHGGATSRAPP